MMTWALTVTNIRSSIKSFMVTSRLSALLVTGESINVPSPFLGDMNSFSFAYPYWHNSFVGAQRPGNHLIKHENI